MVKKILVVDDEPGQVRLMDQVLTHHGYEVLKASQGQEALRIVFEQKPDLVLLDVVMPKMDGWQTCSRIREVTDIPIIMLTGKKWSWDFVYPTGAVTQTFAPLGSRQTPVFYIPAGKPVRLRMISSDVMHAFWVPDFRVKQDVLPNRYTTIWFEAKAPGGDKRLTEKEEPAIADKLKVLAGVPYEDHWVFCAEYCGTEHSEMSAILRAVPADAYQAWLNFVSDPSGLAPAKYGEIMFKAQCASCHSVDGGANTGPTWQATYGNPAIPIEGQPPVVGDENYILESIRNPAAKVHQGFKNQMTPFPESQLSNQKVEAIIAYMKYVSSFTSQAVKDEVMKKPEEKAGEKK